MLVLRCLNVKEIEQANFGTSKKMCKIECSLIMDVIEKYYHPFGELPADDKVLI